MGSRLFKKNIPIDQFVSSPALRAKTTAELFAAEYDRKMKEILFVPSLYHANAENFMEVVLGLEDNHKHIALFSHNPGITDFASSLTDTQITHMPTCSVFAVTTEIDSWKDFANAEKRFLFFYKVD